MLRIFVDAITAQIPFIVYNYETQSQIITIMHNLRFYHNGVKLKNMNLDSYGNDICNIRIKRKKKPSWRPGALGSTMSSWK